MMKNVRIQAGFAGLWLAGLLVAPAGLALAQAPLPAAPVSGSAPAPGLFERQPDWWNAVRVRVDKAATPDATFQQAMALPENQTPRERITDWMVLGPLDLPDNALNVWLPGESYPDVRQTVVGKGGQKQSWRLWKTDAKPPFPSSETRFAALFLKEFPGTPPGRRWLVLEHDESTAVRLNGKLVFRAGQAGVGEVAIPVTIDAQNRLLVKLTQERQKASWRLAATLCPENPFWRPARVGAEVVRLFAAEDPAGCAPVATRVAQSFEQMQDLPNALFWYRRALEMTRDPKVVAKLLEQILRRFDNEAADAPLTAFLRQLTSNSKLDPALRRAAVQACVDELAGQNLYSEALDLLTRNAEEFKTFMGPRWDLAMTRLYIAKGDAVRAREAIRNIPSAAAEEPALQGELKACYAQIQDMQKSMLQLPRDLDFEQIQREAQMISRDNDSQKLVEFVRKTLSERAGLVVDSAEAGLYVGAAARYREVFQPYAASYEPDVRQYAALMVKKFGYSEIQAADLAARASLAPLTLAPGGTGLPSMSSVLDAVDRCQTQAPGPGVLLPPGDLELSWDDLARGVREKAVPAHFGQGRGGLTIVQNSRALARLDKGGVRWLTAFDNSPFPFSRKSAILPGGFNPKTDGRRVYARLVDHGRLTLLAVDAADGAGLWSWSPPGAIICSDPVLWDNSVLVLICRPDAIPRYALVSLQADTGAVEFEHLLCSANPELATGGKDVLRPDIFMPEPAVRNGMAFICTNAGVVYGFNLRARCFQWARIYPRLNSTMSRRMEPALRRRQPSPPVAGTDNVLFSPRDSLSLLLLDQKTGEVRKELSRVDWVDCRALGGNSALVTEAGGGAMACSLRDLATTFRLDGGTPDVLRSFVDGILLVREGVIEVWSESGRSLASSRQPIPDMTPLGVDGGICWGTPASSWLPLACPLATDAAAAAARRPGPVEAMTAEVTNGFLRENDGEVFLIGDNGTVKLDANLQTRWVLPSPDGGPDSVLSGKSVVHVVQGGSILQLDRATGQYLRQYPAFGKPRIAFTGARSGAGDTIWFGVRPADKSPVEIMSMDRDGVHSRGTLPAGALDLEGLFSSGNALVRDGGKWKVMKPDRDGRYAETGVEADLPGYTTNKWGGRTAMIILRAEPDCWLGYHPGGAMMATETRIERLPYCEWKAGGGGGEFQFWPAADARRRLAEDFFALRLTNNGWNLLDLRQKKDLADIALFRGLPSVIGKDRDRIVGSLSRPAGDRHLATVGLGVVDRKQRSLLFRKNVDLNAILDRNGRADYDFSVEVEGQAVHLFKTWNEEMPPYTAAAVDDLKPGTPLTAVSFPSYRSSDGGWCRNGQVLLLLDDHPVRMSQADFLGLATGKSSVRPEPVALESKKPGQILVDGFLDEWPKDAFKPCRDGEYAAEWGSDGSLTVALRLRNPELIRPLAERGPDGRLQFTVLPAALAGFTTVDAKTSFTALCGEKAEDVEFAAAVTPDAAELTAEVRISLQKALKLEPDVRGRSVPRRELTVDFQLRSISGAPVSLTATGVPGWPCQWPRLLLQSGK